MDATNPNDHDAEVAQRRETRDAQLIAPSAASNMIECLARDRDAFAHLTSFLFLSEVAMLDGTCARVHEWLVHARPSIFQTGEWCLWDYEIENFSQCEWARGRVAQLTVTAKTVEEAPRDLRAPRIYRAKQLLLWLHQADRWWAGFSQRLLETSCERFAYQSASKALLCLPSLERLQELAWCVASQLDSDVVRVCFSALGRTLRKLTVVLVSSKFAAGARSTIMSQIASLRELRELVVLRSVSNLDAGAAGRPMHYARAQLDDFSGLAQLEFLHTFHLNAVEAEYFFPSVEQCACLAQCSALTALACGRWDAPTPDARDEFGQPIDFEDPASFLEQRIGVLTAGKGRTIFEVPDAVVMDPGQQPQIRSHGLRTLQLGSQPVMTRAQWIYRSKLVELMELSIRSWSNLITEEEWSLLGRMTQLRSLKIGGVGLNSDHVLNAVCSCSALLTLVLADISISENNLQTLMVSLPGLRSLHLWFTHVTSLAPLHNSPLSELGLSYLQSEDGQPNAFSRLLLAGVSLPQLIFLRITDAEEVRLSPAEAEELNRVIFDACPLLLPKRFEQNLLADA